MTNRIPRLPGPRVWLAVAAVAALLQTPTAAQDRLKTLPGYERYERMSREIPGSVVSGALEATWQDDGRTFEYVRDGKRYRYDVAARRATAIGPAPDKGGRGRGGQAGGPARGRRSTRTNRRTRQGDLGTATCGSPTRRQQPVAITTEGSETAA